MAGLWALIIFELKLFKLQIASFNLCGSNAWFASSLFIRLYFEKCPENFY